MANVRIDNFSGDTVTVIFDGRQEVVADEGHLTIDALEKGRHSICIHRTRLPFESSSGHESTDEVKTPFGAPEKSLHTQLDLAADLDLNSSKSVITVKTSVSAKEGMGTDAIFSSYSLTLTGAKVENESRIFANSSVQKNFRNHHLKSLIFPVGAGGIAILLLAAFALVSHLAGNTINIGGTEFTLPWSLGLTAVGVAINVYTAICLHNILSTVKKYKR
ncbi:MAG: hypothetical protein IKJ69_00405 [Clostridia bacterium]|nr:hypothetical protein [Clostridia bacterium]